MNPLPALHWNPLGSYDCAACIGESRRQGTDCPECGGTGWQHPDRPHDTICRDCHRPLWFGGRGPQWFEHDLSGEVRCRFCLLRASKKRSSRVIYKTGKAGHHGYNLGSTEWLQGRSIVLMNRSLREHEIDLATFVEKGDEERTKS